MNRKTQTTLREILLCTSILGGIVAFPFIGKEIDERKGGIYLPSRGLTYQVIFDFNKDGNPDYVRVTYPIRGGFTNTRKPTQAEIAYFNVQSEIRWNF